MSQNETIEKQEGNKPVNINISFNINPKNILNSVIPVEK